MASSCTALRSALWASTLPLSGFVAPQRPSGCFQKLFSSSTGMLVGSCIASRVCRVVSNASVGFVNVSNLIMRPRNLWPCAGSSSFALPRFDFSVLIGGATSSSNSDKSSVRFTQQRTWPSKTSTGRHGLVTAEYRRGGGGDFAAGFFLGGVVFGALGYILAPQITKSLEGVQIEKEDELSSNLEDEESLETTRRNLNERIAQLSAQIDDVSAQVKNDGFAHINSAVELESA